MQTLLAIIFWLVVLATTIKWLKFSPKALLVQRVLDVTEPPLNKLRTMMPFLKTKKMDFTPFLAVMILLTLHILLVDILPKLIKNYL